MTGRLPAPTCGMLEVGDGQTIYWEERGNTDGVPALYLHGGPGAGLSDTYTAGFDLDRIRLIGFDQRGCGQSTPHASDPLTSLENNTTAALIADIELLRRHLGVRKWIVTGGSWGSTLALAYAQDHPNRVHGLALAAVTSSGRDEIDWITEGVGRIFPEAWDRFAGHAERAGIGYRRGRGRLVEAYAALLESPEPSVRDAAFDEWALWEDVHISIGTDGLHRDPRWNDRRYRDAFLRITAHYWAHDGFCDPPVLDRMERLRDVPGYLIHGRRDISSPTITAWRLRQSWPKSHLTVVEPDGHGGGAMRELVAQARSALVDLVIGSAQT